MVVGIDVVFRVVCGYWCLEWCWVCSHIWGNNSGDLIFLCTFFWHLGFFQIVFVIFCDVFCDVYFPFAGGFACYKIF